MPKVIARPMIRNSGKNIIERIKTENLKFNGIIIDKILENINQLKEESLNLVKKSDSLRP